MSLTRSPRIVAVLAMILCVTATFLFVEASSEYIKDESVDGRDRAIFLLSTESAALRSRCSRQLLRYASHLVFFRGVPRTGQC